MKRKFSDERRTEIAAVSGEVDIEDLIPVEECVLTMTNFGYVKRQKADDYHQQKRGGRGVNGMNRPGRGRGHRDLRHRQPRLCDVLLHPGAGV